MGTRKSSKDIILDAAEAVVADVGAAHMTLDAVARKAGISKGGLIYNFPSKDALLQAMIMRLTERFKQATADRLAEIPGDPARMVKAHIISTVNRDQKTNRTSAALLAAVAHNPRLMGPVQCEHQNYLAEVRKSCRNPECANVMNLAADGLWLLEMLGLSPFPPAQRAAVVREMLRLAEQECGGSPRRKNAKSPRRKSPGGSR
jgi:AcrR family transcriptional regulator